MIGTVTAQPSSHAILDYSYQYHSRAFVTRSAGSLTPPAQAKDLARTGSAGLGADAPGARTPAELLQTLQPGSEGDYFDRVEFGNRRGLLPGTETILAILEEKVNARVEASFHGTETAQTERPDYWSAEATGERIARFALKFYDRYARKHGESEKNLEDFLKYVTGAINEGFAQARQEIANVSGGQEPGSAKSLVDATYNKVMSVLEEFRQAVLDRLRAAQSVGSPGAEAGPREDAAVAEVA